MNYIGNTYIYNSEDVSTFYCLKNPLHKGDKLTVIDSFYCKTNQERTYFVKVNSSTYSIEDADNGGYINEEVLQNPVKYDLTLINLKLNEKEESQNDDIGIETEEIMVPLINNIIEKYSRKKLSNIEGKLLYNCGINELIFSSLYAITGNPSCGKTSFMLSVLWELSIENPLYKSALFSLQNSNLNIGKKLDAMDSRVSLDKIERSLVNPMDIKRIQDAAGRIMESEGYTFNEKIKSHEIIAEKKYLTIVNNKKMKLLKLINNIKKLNKLYNIKCFFIDGLNLIIPEKNYTNYWEMINDYSIELKRIAVELDCAIFITIDSLKNNTDYSKYTAQNIITMPNIAPVGIAQNADVIISISDNCNTDNSNAPEKKRIRLEKNNFSPLYEKEVLFLPAINKFEIYEEEDE